MSRRVAIALGVLVALLLAAQIALPRIAASLVASRLTENGGSAHVHISAFPAPRLLFGDGDSIDVTASGLSVDLATPGGDAFSKLDKFDSVDIALASSKAGPFQIRDLHLTRVGTLQYHLTATAATTPHDLLDFGAQQLGPLGGLALRFGGNGLLGSEAGAGIPIHLDMTMASEGGRVVVTAGSGTVAGIPTGPLAELITAAIAVKL